MEDYFRICIKFILKYLRAELIRFIYGTALKFLVVGH